MYQGIIEVIQWLNAAGYGKGLDAFNLSTINGLMCRHQLHVGWDGHLYDCDFRYALGLQAGCGSCGGALT